MRELFAEGCKLAGRQRSTDLFHWSAMDFYGALEAALKYRVALIQRNGSIFNDSVGNNDDRVGYNRYAIRAVHTFTNACNDQCCRVDF